LIARGLCFANDACQLWQADTEEDLCLAGGPHMTPRWPLKQYQIDFSGGLDFTESGRWLSTANPWCYVTCFVAFTLIDGRMAMQCEASDWDQLTTCAALRRFCTPMMISLFGRIDRCVNPRAMHFYASASPFEALLVDPTSRRWWHERRSEATAWSPKRTLLWTRWFDRPSASLDAVMGNPRSFSLMQLNPAARDTARQPSPNRSYHRTI
jgi:hypothetical protein